MEREREKWHVAEYCKFIEERSEKFRLGVEERLFGEREIPLEQ